MPADAEKLELKEMQVVQFQSQRCGGARGIPNSRQEGSRGVCVALELYVNEVAAQQLLHEPSGEEKGGWGALTAKSLGLFAAEVDR